jgi:hypothetical protein
MTNSDYKRRGDLFRRNYANVVATVALVVALTGVGLVQAGVLVTSKQIKNGTIITRDIHKGGVKSSDIGTSAVRSADIQSGAVEGSDIGTGEVMPQDVTMPDPVQLQETGVASIDAGDTFAHVVTVDTYAKEDPASILQVDWIGTARSPFGTDCIFQIRVDGQPSPDNGGLLFVASGAPVSVSATALFPGLAPGLHAIEIWARQARTPGPTRCIVGPADAGIAQTFVVSEQVV